MTASQLDNFIPVHLQKLQNNELFPNACGVDYAPRPSFTKFRALSYITDPLHEPMPNKETVHLQGVELHHRPATRTDAQ
ncbi:hypothetical protein Tcan_03154 [Toxocara canis]|uniref:Uncharacterized protein n=1 Tax=Toxocara canis TaxID=6265 RepID=A0A0B2UTR1_TOXCA|nr:hypothetical protein Tcan_03154 [Toxocara canis]